MKQKPNVLIVCVDQWAIGAFGCYGSRVVQTPTIDALAGMGIRYTRAYSENPVCMPARRTLLSGTTPRTHGLHANAETETPMPSPTMAQCFRDAGYQTIATGKMHVKPHLPLSREVRAAQRVRFGFEELWLNAEGHPHECGGADDYELFLQDHGCGGWQYTHGMGPNQPTWRTWHLEERLHPTNWTAWAMSRAIQRRDPARPFFAFLSFNHPHPPLTPLAAYLELYRDTPIPAPVMGDWAGNWEKMPAPHRWARDFEAFNSPAFLPGIRRAYYALCTHIDHQLRLVLGMLRETNALRQTAIIFISDHGEMLGNHGLWAKGYPFEESCRIPLLTVLPQGDPRARPGTTDNRLIGLRDIMPTALDIAGIPIPATCEGLSALGDNRRDLFYSEFPGQDPNGFRMVTDGRYKFCYYPPGGQRYLFDLAEDPEECIDLAASPNHREIIQRLEKRLVGELYGRDLEWVRDGQLIPLPKPPLTAHFPSRGLGGQHGLQAPHCPEEPEWC